LKSASGVYVTTPASSETVPCVEPVIGSTAVTVNVCVDSFDGHTEPLHARSLAGKHSVPSSATLFASATAVGASFTSVTVTLTVPVSDFKSLTPAAVTYSLSLHDALPISLKSASGVYVTTPASSETVPCVEPVIGSTAVTVNVCVDS